MCLPGNLLEGPLQPRSALAFRPPPPLRQALPQPPALHETAPHPTGEFHQP